MEIPGYDIQRLVAQGGTSSVFVAVQRSLGRQVALKILKPLDGSAFTPRFLEEGRIIASLNHRNVITIYDVGVLNGWYYIAMEYLEGGSLESRVNGGMPPGQALAILETIAGCLHFVHRRGVIHRDIKPANILFHADGTVRLTDFGIAKQLSADQDLTLDGRALGSPYYLSPEQAECKPLDDRSDIYSLGIVFYELLTGSKPFAGASHIETILAHLTRPVPKLPRELGAFQELLEKMIAKSPVERFASARELTEYVRHLRSSRARKVGLSRLVDRDADSAGTQPEAPLMPWPGLPKKLTAGRRERPLTAMVPVVVLLAVTAGLVGYGTRQAGDIEETSPWPVTAETTAGAAAAQDPVKPVGESERKDSPVVPAGVSDAADDDSASVSAGDTGKVGQGSSSSANDTGLVVAARNTAAVRFPASTTATGREYGSADATAPVADIAGAGSAAPTEQEARLARWLRLADRAIQDYRLTTPRDDSAWFYYRAVLDQEPGNPEAVAGMGRVADTYAALARRKLAENDRDRAKAFVERGLAIRPHHPGLLELEGALAPPEVLEVAEEPAVDGVPGFFRKVRAFMTHPANKSNTELLDQ